MWPNCIRIPTGTALCQNIIFGFVVIRIENMKMHRTVCFYIGSESFSLCMFLFFFTLIQNYTILVTTVEVSGNIIDGDEV